MLYTSELTGKSYKTVKELEAAEKEFNKAHEAELKAKEEKKTAAEAVKKAIKARIKAEIASKKAKAEAYKVYLEACDKADKTITEAKKAEKEQLSLFCDKYGSFHDTITIGDIIYNCDYSIESTIAYSDPFKRLLDFWF